MVSMKMANIFLFAQEVYNMGAPQEILEEIFTVIEGGNVVGESAEIIQFPSDNGQNTFSVVQRSVQGANGTGVNYWVSAVASGLSALSAGALMVTATFPEFVALAVPCLGIAVGTIWYNLSPEFWDSLSEKLVEGGYTLNGKIVTYMNKDGNLVLPTGSLELLADALIDAGVFTPGQNILPEEEQSELFNPGAYSECNLLQGLATARYISENAYGQYEQELWFDNRTGSRPIYTGFALLPGVGTSGTSIYPFAASEAPFEIDYFIGPSTLPTRVHLTGLETTRNGKTYYVTTSNGAYGVVSPISINNRIIVDVSKTHQGWGEADISWDAMYIMENGVRDDEMEDVLQDGATYPIKGMDWGDLYPEWVPWEFPLIPVSGGDHYQLPPGLPVEYPDNLPIEQPYQKEAQDPKENIRKRHSLFVTEKGDSAVDGGNPLVSESLDLLAKQMLQAKKTGCNKLKFHCYSP